MIYPQMKISQDGYPHSNALLHFFTVKIFVLSQIGELQAFLHLTKCDLFVCFDALRPKSTAMVIAGRSVHLTTLFFLGRLEQAVNQ